MKLLSVVGIEETMITWIGIGDYILMKAFSYQYISAVLSSNALQVVTFLDNLFGLYICTQPFVPSICDKDDILYWNFIKVNLSNRLKLYSHY